MSHLLRRRHSDGQIRCRLIWQPSGQRDLIGYRTFDEGFSVDLRQPSSVVDALLHVMGKARIARREFRAGTEIAAAMEDDAKAYRAECVARWSAAADTAMKAELGLKAKTRA